MTMYLNDKPVKVTENTRADEALKVAVEQWNKDNPNHAATLAQQYDPKFLGVRAFERTETVVADEPTYKISCFTDGTVRKDNRQPPAPKPAPVTVATPIIHTQDDLARLYQGGVTSITTKDGKFSVSEPEQQQQSNGFKRSGPRPGVPHEEFGDSFKRP